MKTEKILDQISSYRDYEWNWYHDQEYSEKEGKWLRYPFLVTAPSGGSTALRIYAHGGNVLSIPTREIKEKVKNKNPDKNFYKYCLNEWEDKNEKKNRIPRSFIDDFQDQYQECENQIKKIFCSSGGEMSTDDKNQFCAFVALAASNRFRKKDGTRMERWTEQAALRNMFKKKYDKDAEDQTILFDMEYYIDLQKEREYIKIEKGGKGFSVIDKEKPSKKCKPDFIAFDAKTGSFGLIEMKYDRDSMARGSRNSLLNHYLDFHAALSNQETAKEMKLEFLRRIWFLIRYGIIDSSWKEAFRKNGFSMDLDYEQFINAAEKATEANERTHGIWTGFLFIDEEGKKYAKRAEDYYLKAIEEQLNIEMVQKIVENQDLCRDLCEIRYMVYNESVLEETIPIRWNKYEEV